MDIQIMLSKLLPLFVYPLAAGTPPSCARWGRC
jgi:hypothetical protein